MVSQAIHTPVGRVALVFAGGVLGSAGRWGASELWRGGSLPWGTLAVNLFGAAVLGALLPRLLAGARHERSLVLFAGIGLLGALTTFSALSLEVVDLVRDGRGLAAVVYVALSVGGGFLLAAVGYRTGSTAT